MRPPKVWGSSPIHFQDTGSASSPQEKYLDKRFDRPYWLLEVEVYTKVGSCSAESALRVLVVIDA